MRKAHLFLIALVALLLLPSCRPTSVCSDGDLFSLYRLHITVSDRLRYRLGDHTQINALRRSAVISDFNGHPELSVIYCGKALEIDSCDWMSYALRGMAYQSIAQATGDIDQCYKSAADFNDAFRYNTRRRDLTWPGMDTITYADLVLIANRTSLLTHQTAKTIQKNN